MKESVELLTKLGLKEYEARVFSALVSEGPSGVSRIATASGVPRNKVYDAVRGLSAEGMVESQPGRPVIFRAAPPGEAVARLVERYQHFATSAVSSLEKEMGSSSDGEEEHVWVVTGRQAVFRRVAETVLAASSGVFATEPYPPEWIPIVKNILMKAKAKGVRVRAVSILGSDDGSPSPEDRLIEYREAKRGATGEVARMFLASVRMSSTLIVDDSVVIDIVKSARNPAKVSGIVTTVTGVPFFQRMTMEGLIDAHTRRVP